MTYLYLRCGEGQALTEAQHALLAAEKPERVFIETAASPDALTPMLEQLGEGDCVVAERFADLADDSRGFLERLAALTAQGAALCCVREGFDTRTEAGAAARDALLAVAALDAEGARRSAQREGIERAREAGKYKGRRPIAVDDEKLSAVAARWRSGEITAREAMQELGLKPNTFYRRIKEMGAEAVKGAGAAAEQAVKGLKEGVSAGAEELRGAAGRVLDAAKEARVGEKVKEAAGQVVAAAKESKVGERIRECAEDVVEGVRDAELGRKVREGIETAREVVGTEIEACADQLRRDVADIKARAGQREEPEGETQEPEAPGGEAREPEDTEG